QSGWLPAREPADSESASRVDRRALLARLAEPLGAQALLEDPRELLRLQSELRANLLGPQSIFVLLHERNDLVEDLADILAAAPLQAAGAGDLGGCRLCDRGRRGAGSGGGAAIRGDELVERSASNGVDDGIGERGGEGIELGAEGRHVRAAGLAC